MMTHNRQARYLLCAMILTFCCGSAIAASEKVIYAFKGAPDGRLAYSDLVSDSAGNLYGTTCAGGDIDRGTVYELSPSGNIWTEKILYSFTSAADGGCPMGALAFDSLGNAYGTTDNAGEVGCGTVFQLVPSGDQWQEQTIYTFQNTGDGCNPDTPVVIDPLGNIFGTTSARNSCCSATVFQLAPSNGQWIETTLYAFEPSRAFDFVAGLTLDATGNLYGTTPYGGNYGGGDVFKLSQVSGSWVISSLFSFSGGNNGCVPHGVTLDSAGNLYGTTIQCGADEVGTVFKLTPTKGQWGMKILHTFTGALDGGYPFGDLKLDTAGNVYGTTEFGGLYGLGTAFRLTKGSWKELEYSFAGGNDGRYPYSGLTLGNGVVFGTTVSGGVQNKFGTVYEISVK